MTTTDSLAVRGIVAADDMTATVDAIATIQLPDGNIPWTPGDHTDPWNLVEAAMALDVGGRHADAERAYEWLRTMQRPDGAWHAYYVGNDIKDPTLDTNVTCYIANGVLAPLPVHGRRPVSSTDFWPVVERAIDFVLDHQAATGEIAWRVDDSRAGMARRLAHRLVEHSREPALRDRPRRASRTRASRLGAVTRLAGPCDRAPARRLSRQGALGDGLVLPGARGRVARRGRGRIASRAGWRTFVVEGRGVRCVSDRPWITAAETCELVLALDAIGERERAFRLFEWVQFLRADGGGYWTGANFEGGAFQRDGELYPVEQPTWNSAAVVLAANALGGSSLDCRVLPGQGDAHRPRPR